MGYIVVFIVAFLIPSIPVEGADHEWVATDYEGSCRQIGFKIHNDSIQVAENSTFHLPFFQTIAGELEFGR